MVYRTHDNPNPEKLNLFSAFAGKFGHQLNFQGNISKELNKLTEALEGKPEESILQQLAIRTMSKAIYSTEPSRHFGLGFEHYTHFTSPIRRYPDLMVHRLLQHYLDGGESVARPPFEDNCQHSSDREKVAADAERASIKYKQVEYIMKHDEKVFDGIISGVTEWGLYVEMTSARCEGLLKYQELRDDRYVFDEDNFRAIGMSNKKIYAFGDKITVRVIRTDLRTRNIDLTLESEDTQVPNPKFNAKKKHHNYNDLDFDN
jgi:ribonuclease R